ncbi:MAG TPA: sensor histidine kinase [Terriglobales bacterium]
MTSLLDSSSKLFSPIRRELVIERYGLALASAVLAVLLRWLFDPVLGHVAFYVTVYAAVAFCAVVCGFAPAIVSAVAGFLGIFYWFIDPRYSLSPNRPTEIHNFVGFFFVCIVLIAFGEANRRKQLKLNSTIVALTAQRQERERAEADLQQAHDELERRVQERTAELSRALARFESEMKVRKRAEEQLRQLSVRLMNLQDEERRRIARDLHDTAGQTLAAIKMISATIQQSAAGSPEILHLIDEINSFTDEALQEIRTTSYLLHPPLLDESGIASAARWFVEGFAKRSGVQAQCEIAEQMERPPRNHELVLFRVLQESLTNIHRHSGASESNVKLDLEAGWIKLEVADNGHGIPEDRLKRLTEAEGSTGVGLIGMRERVYELGGRLEIDSGADGTTVRVALPMQKGAPLQANRLTSAA